MEHQLNQVVQESVLSAHTDTNQVSREELAVIPTPGGTATFKPVSHIELIQSLQAIFELKGVKIVKEQFAVRSDGSKLFGTFDLSIEGLGQNSSGALGFRTANDRTMKLQMITGMRVFVCDNMAFSGDAIVLNRKHTKNLDLLPELMKAVNRYMDRYAALRAEIMELTSITLLDNEAKALIHDAFVQDYMPIRYLPQVSDCYFQPKHSEFEPRTAWSLHNAFSEVAKDMHLNRRMLAMQEIGNMFGLNQGSNGSNGDEIEVSPEEAIDNRAS